MTGEVTDQIILFSMILMRMSGFVLLILFWEEEEYRA